MIDFDVLARTILDAAVRGLDKGAVVVMQRAKARAPVRNIFGNRYRFRPKTVGEMSADLRFIDTKTIEEMSETGLGTFGTRWVGPKSLSKQGLAQMGQRTWGAAQEHLARYEAGEETPLTRQGASEVRSGRARYHSVREGGEATIGGRLRGEIRVVSAKRVGSMATAEVISPTKYAKYMEFGTRHNRAHPFLRPALEESREEVIGLIAGAVKEASGSVRLKITVHL